jgi:lipoprotein-releasing system permease protein
VALNIDVIVPAIERAAGRGLPARQHLRDQPHAQRAAGRRHRADGLISLVLAFLATLYPSWRASRVNPAEALRYE